MTRPGGPRYCPRCRCRQPIPRFHTFHKIRSPPQLSPGGPWQGIGGDGNQSWKLWPPFSDARQRAHGKTSVFRESYGITVIPVLYSNFSEFWFWTSSRQGWFLSVPLILPPASLELRIPSVIVCAVCRLCTTSSLSARRGARVDEWGGLENH